MKRQNKIPACFYQQYIINEKFKQGFEETGKFPAVYLLFTNIGKQILQLIYSLCKSHAWWNIILWRRSSDICIGSRASTGKVQILQSVPAVDDRIYANSYES